MAKETENKDINASPVTLSGEEMFRKTKDWFKMTSRDVFTDSKKGRYQIHYDMNAKTGQTVNPKRKYIDLK